MTYNQLKLRELRKDLFAFIIVILGLFIATSAWGQTVKPDTLFKNKVKTFKPDGDSYSTKTTALPYNIAGLEATTGTYYTVQHVPQNDTVQCYFQEITRVVNGVLRGKWNDGWLVFPHSAKTNNGYSFIQSYSPIYLYHNKKRVTNKVIQQY